MERKQEALGFPMFRFAMLHNGGMYLVKHWRFVSRLSLTAGVEASGAVARK